MGELCQEIDWLGMDMIVRSCMERVFKNLMSEIPMVVEPVVKNLWG